MARLYQKIDGEAVPLGGGGGGSVAIDNETITKNSDDEIQVATALTGKINQLDNVAADAGKVLTANGDGTAEWENGYVEGFYGTTAEWDALTYAQKQAWVQKNPKVTFTDDYVSNIKQDVAGCISSTNENDVVGASALKEALTYSTAETEIGLWIDGKPLYQKTFTKVFTRTNSAEDVDMGDFSTADYKVREMTASAMNSANHAVLAIPYYQDSNNFIGAYQSGSWNKMIVHFSEQLWNLSSGVNPVTIYMTIKYTKNSEE